jgi:cytoskeletal protein RodZ
MTPKQLTFRNYLLSTFALIIIGWGGIVALFYFSLPFVWSRWGFFVLGIMALTGTALPVVYFFHRRFPSEPPAEPNVIVRQALWVGVYASTLAWLQLGRLVTLYVILGLAGGLIAIEYFIRLREKANRTPPTISDDDPS